MRGALVAIALGATSVAQGAEPRRVDLRELFATTTRTYPEVAVAAADVEAAGATRSLTHATRRWHL